MGESLLAFRPLEDGYSEAFVKYAGDNLIIAFLIGGSITEAEFRLEVAPDGSALYLRDNSDQVANAVGEVDSAAMDAYPKEYILSVSQFEVGQNVVGRPTVVLEGKLTGYLLCTSEQERRTWMPHQSFRYPKDVVATPTPTPKPPGTWAYPELGRKVFDCTRDSREGGLLIFNTLEDGSGEARLSFDSNGYGSGTMNVDRKTDQELNLISFTYSVEEGGSEVHLSDPNELGARLSESYDRGRRGQYSHFHVMHVPKVPIGVELEWPLTVELKSDLTGNLFCTNIWSDTKWVAARQNP